MSEQRWRRVWAWMVDWGPWLLGGVLCGLVLFLVVWHASGTVVH